VLKISILPQYFFKMTVSGLKFCIFGRKFLDKILAGKLSESFLRAKRKKISDNFPTAQNLGGGSCPLPSYHDATGFKTVAVLRYDALDDLHWKTDRQAASLI